MNKLFFSLLLLIGLCVVPINAQNRWSINPNGSISWEVKGRIPHYDHIEMSGLKVSAVLRYGVNADGSFELNKSMIWPMLRTIPNNTHASLMRRFAWNASDMVSVNGQSLSGEKVGKITLDGTMTVESTVALPRKAQVTMTRIVFPSVSNPAICEKYILRNTGESAVNVEIPVSRSVIDTDPAIGVDGSYRLVSEIIGSTSKQLQPKEELVFYASISGYKQGETEQKMDIEKELQARKDLIAGFWNNLILETPDPVVNTMFAFAKIRGAESIYDTKGGLMHGPGGESYYAAIWANDQAEYINPFFPYLGYEVGNGSALNSFKHFARFMNPEYEKIPSSIIAEGLDVWGGAGDRGDAAMVAYGAARYALARGDKGEAEELWPLIEWCLEYCRRNLNDKGVVASDSDELEGRFPAGKANLCTSSLYYDALRSASYLGKDLQKPFSELADYEKQAKDLRKNIEDYFGAKVEGFDTYQYYEGNDILRSWICIPLTVGINDRTDGTINALFSPRLWTKNGLLTQAGSETFWDRSTLYALRGVYACGATEKATEYLKFYSNQRLLGDHVPYAIEAWPEGSQRHLSAESGLYCRIITEGLFGIRPTGLKSFTFTPRLPAEWDQMNLRKIKAFNSTFDIEVTSKNGKQSVAVKTGGKTLLHKTFKAGEVISVKLP
ncbi:hypothetical protein M1P97_20110 [Parabacteroides sp. GYB001]|uniref:hypothetical protein n=1 Tax=Parabacteroides leei TaxID=2939491 RepID=UPI002016D7CF|nr:hypothetical protein [Parabacteroides leei]MCL3853592.1 hypothetical protein [Parabacteroides leei]